MSSWKLRKEQIRNEGLHVLPFSAAGDQGEQTASSQSRIAIVNINPGERVRGVSSEWEITIARCRSAGR
jgi:hypothetical protein